MGLISAGIYRVPEIGPGRAVSGFLVYSSLDFVDASGVQDAG